MFCQLEEYAEIRWDQLEAGDVNFIKEIFTTVWRIVLGELESPG